MGDFIDSSFVMDSEGHRLDIGVVHVPEFWSPSGQTIQRVDFSKLTQPGTYRFADANGVLLSHPFTISETPYTELLHGVLKFYYYQRASLELEAKHAGKHARPAGHFDLQVAIHSDSQAPRIDSPKGWYDAGDYGKYIVNSGITMATLFLLWEDHKNYLENQHWNIPESGEGLPDLLAEIRWNLDWMLTMQDLDGGVYSKLSTERFCGVVMPHEDTAPRFVILKTTAATLHFAAVTAQAYRHYFEYDTPYAQQCLVASQKAFAWAMANPAIYFVQPQGVNTGEYREKQVEDKFFWAASELFLATQDPYYQQVYQNYEVIATIPNWQVLSTMGLICQARHAEVFGDDAFKAKQKLLDFAKGIQDRALKGFGAPLENHEYEWGSNSVAANQGVVLVQAYIMTNDVSYLHAAQRVLDFIIGCNPLDMCYVTGFGTQSPQHPHHRPSEADGIEEPVPGMLVGGPHEGGQDIGSGPWMCNNYHQVGKPALCYFDNRCSFATNEVAINWNASFAYLVGAMVAIYCKFKM